MARSLGLTLYNLGQRRGGPDPADRLPRPPGPLVWLHAPDAEAARAQLELARRLVEEDGVAVLLTCPDPLPSRPGVVLHPPPGDSPAEVRAFLDHWRPDALVCAQGELRPGLVHEAGERGLAVLMVDARDPVLIRSRDGWYPGLVRATLSGFRRVMAVDEAAARNFRKAGAALSAVSVIGRMEEASATLPYSEPERAALARLFATRPVWLAVDVPQAEDAAVIAAHRAALRLAHRLLLIVVPETPGRADALMALAEAEGWSVARRSAEQEPDPETEVFLADGGNEYGLWYRLSPITYLGGSLSGPQGAGRDPREAAALGSALICGPRAGVYAAAWSRLSAARALRRVDDAVGLAEALSDLLSPERAARLAQAAWAASSEGAEATERVLAEVRRIMDGEG